MKAHPFTRPTIVAAVEFLGEMLTQARFDQLAVRLGLDDEIPQGPAKSALLARIVIRIGCLAGELQCKAVRLADADQGIVTAGFA